VFSSVLVMNVDERLSDGRKGSDYTNLRKATEHLKMRLDYEQQEVMINFFRDERLRALELMHDSPHVMSKKKYAIPTSIWMNKMLKDEKEEDAEENVENAEEGDVDDLDEGEEDYEEGDEDLTEIEQYEKNQRRRGGGVRSRCINDQSP